MATINAKKHKRIDGSKVAFFCILCLPPLLLYILFSIYPVINAIYTSFFDWSGYSELTSDMFVGLQNYEWVLTDPEFLAAIKNDFFIVFVKEIMICVLAVLFAVSLTRLRFRKFETGLYRFIYYVPNVLSTVVITTIWRFIVDSNFGFLNPILRAVGLGSLVPEYGWLSDHPLGVISFVASWCGIGSFMIILIAAINGISQEQYEAAKIDGAGEWRQLIHITMPEVWEQTKFMVFTILYSSFGGNFGMVQAMLGSGVNENSVVMGKFVYYYGYESLNPQVGYSYAAAVILLIISATLSLTVRKLMSRRDDA